MTILSALMWLFGTLGVGGAIAAVAAVLILGPAGALLLIQGIAGVARTVILPAVVKIAKAIVQTRAGVGAICFVVAWILADQHRANLDEATFRQSSLRAELAQKAADLDAARKSAADEADRANTIEANANEQRSKDAAYIETLQSRPACALDDADLPDGMRHDRPRATRAKPSPGTR